MHMKNILPILTLTTLAAAASAQVAAPAAAGFNYNTVSLGYSLEDFKNTRDRIQLTTLSYSSKLSKSLVGNFGLINGSDAGNSLDLQGFSLGLGYIYSVNDKLDVVASWNQSLLQTSDGDSQNINLASYDVSARYAVAADWEITASLGRSNYINESGGVTRASRGDFRTSYSVGVAYKVNAQITVNAKATVNDSAAANGDSRGYAFGVSYAY